MGIRIRIDWTFVSPLLRIASGILKVEVVTNGKVNKLLFKCKVKKESGSLGYSSSDKNDESLSIPHRLFEELKPTIDVMVRSYFQGMILENSDFHWIEDSLSKPFEEWAEEKGIDPHPERYFVERNKE